MPRHPPNALKTLDSHYPSRAGTSPATQWTDMFIKTRQEPRHEPPTPDADNFASRATGSTLRPSSNKPIHNDKQREDASNTGVRQEDRETVRDGPQFRPPRSGIRLSPRSQAVTAAQVQIPRREQHTTDRRRPISAPALLPSLVEVNGIEPSTSCLQSRRSPN